MSRGPVFAYGQREMDYLRQKDKLLGEAMDRIGKISRGVTPDLFQALVNSIIGQQISTKAQQTIWARMQERLEVTPSGICALPAEEVQRCGITMKKAQYIKEIARRVRDGEFDLQRLHNLSDEQVCRELSALPGIGVWTAEMLMLFSMQRPNVFSFGDLAIHRGLRMLYHHRKVERPLFEKYRRRYAPYGSVASLYLWAIAGGEYGYRDYAPNKQAAGKANMLPQGEQKGKQSKS